MTSMCPISQEPIVHRAFVQPCNHEFELGQIEHWYNREVQAGRTPTCPIDRGPIAEITRVSSRIENALPSPAPSDIQEAAPLGEGREISLDMDKGRRFATLFNQARLVRHPAHPEILEDPATKKALYEGLVAKLDQTGPVRFADDELFAFRQKVKTYSKLCSSDYRATRNAGRLGAVQAFLRNDIRFIRV